MPELPGEAGPQDRRQPENGSRSGSSTRSSAAARCWASAAPASSATAASGARAIKNALRVAGTMAEDRLATADRRATGRCAARRSRGDDSGDDRRASSRSDVATESPELHRAMIDGNDSTDAQDRLLVPRPGCPVRRHGARARPELPAVRALFDRAGEILGHRSAGASASRGRPRRSKRPTSASRRSSSPAWRRSRA